MWAAMGCGYVHCDWQAPDHGLGPDCRPHQGAPDRRHCGSQGAGVHKGRPGTTRPTTKVWRTHWSSWPLARPIISRSTILRHDPGLPSHPLSAGATGPSRVIPRRRSESENSWRRPFESPGMPSTCPPLGARLSAWHLHGGRYRFHSMTVTPTRQIAAPTHSERSGRR